MISDMIDQIKTALCGNCGGLRSNSLCLTCQEISPWIDYKKFRPNPLCDCTYQEPSTISIFCDKCKGDRSEKNWKGFKSESEKEMWNTKNLESLSKIIFLGEE